MHTNRAKIAFVVTQATNVNVSGIFNSLLFLFEIHQTFYYSNNERRPPYVYFTRVKFDNSQFDLNLSAEFNYLKSVCVFGNTIICFLSPPWKSVENYPRQSGAIVSGIIFAIRGPSSYRQWIKQPPITSPGLTVIVRRVFIYSTPRKKSPMPVLHMPRLKSLTLILLE